MTLANLGHVINCTEVIINDSILLVKSNIIRKISVNNPLYEVKLKISLIHNILIILIINVFVFSLL